MTYSKSPFAGLFSKVVSQGLIRCLNLSMELLSMAEEEVEGFLFPVVSWVALVSVVVLLLGGGICLGFYIRIRYYVELHFLLFNFNALIM